MRQAAKAARSEARQENTRRDKRRKPLEAKRDRRSRKRQNFIFIFLLMTFNPLNYIGHEMAINDERFKKGEINYNKYCNETDLIAKKLERLLNKQFNDMINKTSQQTEPIEQYDGNDR